MKIIERGHIYELHQLDLPKGQPYTPAQLTFVNREPGTEHPGTQTQEVLRALIDRTMHCDNCLRWPGNDGIIYHLRMALVLHEARALERKVQKGYIQPERICTDPNDGHFDIVPGGMVSCDSGIYSNKPKPDSPLKSKMPDHGTGVKQGPMPDRSIEAPPSEYLTEGFVASREEDPIDVAARKNSRAQELKELKAQVDPAQRKHLVSSAAYWFRSSRILAADGKWPEAVLAMENAYNHVEGALAELDRKYYGALHELGKLRD